MVPARAINAVGGAEAKVIYIKDWAQETEEALQLNSWADVIVIQRMLVNEVIPMVTVLRHEMGKIVVVDVDDAYSIIPLTLRSNPYWKQGLIPLEEDKYIQLVYTPIEQLQWGTKLCHALTTPSEVLRQDWLKYIPNAYLLPNYIEAEHYLAARTPKTSLQGKKRIRVGWGGSASHIASFTDSKCVAGLRRLMEVRKDVEVVLCGGQKPLLQMLKTKHNFYQLLSVPWVPHSEWPKALNTFDIGLIPLAGAYDERRSWVKPLEYAIMGIPWVGIRNRMTEQYEDMGELIQPKTEDWVGAIVDMIDHYDFYLERARSLIPWAEAQEAKKNVPNILEVYEQICNL